MKVILEHLKEVEGDSLHRLTHESDITAPYGIYKYEHPDASIFTYIIEIAVDNGFNKNTTTWTSEDINIIDSLLDKDTIYNLAEVFYTSFLKNAHIDDFNTNIKIAACSLYTNSPRLMWKSVQSSINKFNSNGWIDYKKQSVDGSYGKNTFNGLNLINDAISYNNLYSFLFEALMVSHMQLEYAKLVKSNPDKYLINLNGWNNRVTKLLES